MHFFKLDIVYQIFLNALLCIFLFYSMSQEKVRDEIEKGKGKQFDPIIAQVMIEMICEDKGYTMREKR